MKTKLITPFVITAWLCSLTHAAPLLLLAAGLSARAQPFSIDWCTIDGGGGTSSGGVYSLSGAIGQADAFAKTSRVSFSVFLRSSVVQLPTPRSHHRGAKEH